VISSQENKTYCNVNVTSGFAVNESISLISYVIFGSDKVFVVENATLASLAVDLHAVTVCAWTVAENVEASKILPFKITEPKSQPFAAALFVVASAVFNHSIKRGASGLL
jgi:hypothetical protein